MSKMNDNINISFPVEFSIEGTPVSLQSKHTKSKNTWKETVKATASAAVGTGCWASTEQVSLTIYDFPTDLPQGDVDNIVKLIQDGLVGPIVVDDAQITRVTAQRFLPEELETFDEFPEILGRASVNDPPYVYIRVATDPLGDAQ